MLTCLCCVSLLFTVYSDFGSMLESKHRVFHEQIDCNNPRHMYIRTVREYIEEFTDGVALDYHQSRCLAFLMRHENDDKLDVVRMCVCLESTFGAGDFGCHFDMRRCVQLIIDHGTALVDWSWIYVKLRGFIT